MGVLGLSSMSLLYLLLKSPIVGFHVIHVLTPLKQLVLGWLPHNRYLATGPIASRPIAIVMSFSLQSDFCVPFAARSKLCYVARDRQRFRNLLRFSAAGSGLSRTVGTDGSYAPLTRYVGLVGRISKRVGRRLQICACLGSMFREPMCSTDGACHV